MGYESRVYVVEETSFYSEKRGKYWGQVVAMMDMGKIGGKPECFKAEAGCYIFGDDGNTVIEEDRYGQPLMEAEIGDFVCELKKLKKNSPDYRRWNPMIMFLEGSDQKEWNNLKVYHYGY